MKIVHVLLFCFVSALWDGHIITAKISMYPHTEGTNLNKLCSFGASEGQKFFCRGECQGEDVLVKTNGVSSQSGRYGIKYEHKSSTRGFLTVTIAQLIKSDSGRYRCGLGEPLAPETYMDFDIKVTDASQTGPAKKELPVLRATERKDFRLYCPFSVNKNPKFFCRNQCKDGDLLIQTSEVRAQRGRYIAEYEDGSEQNPIFLYLTITQVTESDAGRYRCGVGSPSSPDAYLDFDLGVGDASTTSEPNPSTSVPKTTDHITASTTSEPNPSTSVPKTTDHIAASTTSEPSPSTSVPKTTDHITDSRVSTSSSSTSVPTTSILLTGPSEDPRQLHFLLLVVCLPLVTLLSAGFLLGLYVCKKRRRSLEPNARPFLLAPLCSVEPLPAVQSSADI